MSFAETLEKARGGDRDAYDQLCNAALNSLYAAAVLALDKDDAALAVDKALTDAQSGISRIKTFDHFKAWVTRTLARGMIAKLKEYKAAGKIPTGDDAVMPALRLPDIERLVFALSAAGGYKKHEISLILGIPEDSVPVRLESAEKRLGEHAQGVKAYAVTCKAPEYLKRQIIETPYSPNDTQPVTFLSAKAMGTAPDEEKPEQEQPRLNAKTFIEVVSQEHIKGGEFLRLIGNTRISNSAYHEIEQNPDLTKERLIQLLEEAHLDENDYYKLLSAVKQRREIIEAKEESRARLEKAGLVVSYHPDREERLMHKDTRSELARELDINEEAKRLEEERRAEEAKRLEEERRAEEARRLEEERRAEEARRLEEERRAEEARRLEEERRAEEAKRLEKMQRLEEENKRFFEERRRRFWVAKRKAAERRVAEAAQILENTMALDIGDISDEDNEDNEIATEPFTPSLSDTYNFDLIKDDEYTDDIDSLDDSPDDPDSLDDLYNEPDEPDETDEKDADIFGDEPDTHEKPEKPEPKKAAPIKPETPKTSKKPPQKPAKKRGKSDISEEISDDSDDIYDDKPKKKSKKGLVIGLISAAAVAAAGFGAKYAYDKGVFGDIFGNSAVEAESDAPTEQTMPTVLTSDADVYEAVSARTQRRAFFTPAYVRSDGKPYDETIGRAVIQLDGGIVIRGRDGLSVVELTSPPTVKTAKLDRTAQDGYIGVSCDGDSVYVLYKTDAGVSVDIYDSELKLVHTYTQGGSYRGFKAENGTALLVTACAITSPDSGKAESYMPVCAFDGESSPLGYANIDIIAGSSYSGYAVIGAISGGKADVKAMLGCYDCFVSFDEGCTVLAADKNRTIAREYSASGGKLTASDSTVYAGEAFSADCLHGGAFIGFDSVDGTLAVQNGGETVFCGIGSELPSGISFTGDGRAYVVTGAESAPKLYGFDFSGGGIQPDEGISAERVYTDKLVKCGEGLTGIRSESDGGETVSGLRLSVYTYGDKLTEECAAVIGVDDKTAPQYARYLFTAAEGDPAQIARSEDGRRIAVAVKYFDGISDITRVMLFSSEAGVLTELGDLMMFDTNSEYCCLSIYDGTLYIVTESSVITADTEGCKPLGYYER